MCTGKWLVVAKCMVWGKVVGTKYVDVRDRIFRGVGLDVVCVCVCVCVAGGVERERGRERKRKLPLGHLCLFMRRICFFKLFVYGQVICLCLDKCKRRVCVCVCVYQDRVYVLDGALVCWHIEQCIHVYDTCVCMVSRCVL